uniref:Uncharacterized protein n=1 Tax=Arundo donax TaxID=35708 RepID=A0A0A9E843_ARUDO
MLIINTCNPPPSINELQLDTHAAVCSLDDILLLLPFPRTIINLPHLPAPLALERDLLVLVVPSYYHSKPSDQPVAADKTTSLLDGGKHHPNLRRPGSFQLFWSREKIVIVISFTLGITIFLGIVGVPIVFRVSYHVHIVFF